MLWIRPRHGEDCSTVVEAITLVMALLAITLVKQDLFHRSGGHNTCYGLLAKHLFTRVLFHRSGGHNICYGPARKTIVYASLVPPKWGAIALATDSLAKHLFTRVLFQRSGGHNTCYGFGFARPEPVKLRLSH